MRFCNSSRAGRRIDCDGSLLLLLVGLFVTGAGCVRFTAPAQTTFVEEPGITGAVARWLEDYRGAWNTGDSVNLGRMMDLSQAEVWNLQRMFEERPDLRVVIDDLHIEPLNGSLARATYVRRDRWTDRTTGQTRSSSAAYEQTFRLADGTVRQISLRRR
jgi:hypothetical protein